MKNKAITITLVMCMLLCVAACSKDEVEEKASAPASSGQIDENLTKTMDETGKQAQATGAEEKAKDENGEASSPKNKDINEETADLMKSFINSGDGAPESPWK